MKLRKIQNIDPVLPSLESIIRDHLGHDSRLSLPVFHRDQDNHRQIREATIERSSYTDETGRGVSSSDLILNSKDSVGSSPSVNDGLDSSKFVSLRRNKNPSLPRTTSTEYDRIEFEETMTTDRSLDYFSAEFLRQETPLSLSPCSKLTRSSMDKSGISKHPDVEVRTNEDIDCLGQKQLCERSPSVSSIISIQLASSQSNQLTPENAPVRHFGPNNYMLSKSHEDDRSSQIVKSHAHICPMDQTVDNLPLSLEGMEKAKARIKDQAARIRELEAELEHRRWSHKPMTNYRKNSRSSKEAKQNLVESKAKPLTRDEILLAYRERKKEEEKYKEASGKWEKPPLLQPTSLVKKVKRKDDLVERLVSNPSERKRLDEVQKSVARTVKKYETEIDVSDETDDTNGSPDIQRSSCALRSNGSKPSRIEWMSDLNNKQLQSCHGIPGLQNTGTGALLLTAGNKNMTLQEARGNLTQNNALDEKRRSLRVLKNQKKQWKITNDYHTGWDQPSEMNENSFLCRKKEDSRGYNVEPQHRCATCLSVEDLEKDVDDPDVFYCRQCWVEYESSCLEDPPILEAKCLRNRIRRDTPLESEHISRQIASVAQPPLAPPPVATRKQDKDYALWLIHDNPQLGNRIDCSGVAKMKCLLETKEPGQKNCVRIVTGTIEYSGKVICGGLSKRQRLEKSDLGEECIRLGNTVGYMVNHNEVETRLEENQPIQAFRLDARKGEVLSSGTLHRSAKEFLSGCKGAVDVVLDPQCSNSEWYPQKEAGDGFRKIAPQFRSKGVGYIRLGDDMGKNGLAFLSDDSCVSFFSTVPVTVQRNASNKDLPNVFLPLDETVTSQPNPVLKRTKPEVWLGQKPRLSITKAVSIRGYDGDSDSDNESNDDKTYADTEFDHDKHGDPADILKQLDSMTSSNETSKWTEKAKLITKLADAIINSASGREYCDATLKAIQKDYISSKHINVHVLRSALHAVGKIGRCMEADLATQIYWNTILIESLKLLKNKQISGIVKEMLKDLHGCGFALANSLSSISHAMGLGKGAQISLRGTKSVGTSNLSALSSDRKPGTLVANNAEIIEWLAETTERERSMINIPTLLDEAGLLNLAAFFLSHAHHREARCRKNALDGLLHTIAYGVDRLGMKIVDAQAMCSELSTTNPKAWAVLIKSVLPVLEENKPRSWQKPR